MTRNTITTASHPLRLAASLSLCLALPLGGCIKSLDLDDGDDEGAGESSAESGGPDTEGGGATGGGATGSGGTGNVSTSGADEEGEATSATDTAGGGTAEDLCPGFCVWENTCNEESDPQCVASCVENYDAYADLDAACNQAMHEWTACVSMVQGCDIADCSVWAYALQACEETYSCSGGGGGNDLECEWERSCGYGPVYAMSCAEGTCSCTIDGEAVGECEQGMVCGEDNLDGLEQAMNDCCGFES